MRAWQWLLIGAGLAYSAAWAKKSIDVNLKHFSSAEFGPWWPLMNKELVQTLDRLRGSWGHPIVISSAPGALGRELGEGNNSQHNVIKWGEVRAVDIMPLIIENGARRGLAYPFERKAFFDVCVQIGFTGIGVYPFWKPFPGFHVDVRADRHPGSPATWAGIPNKYGEQVYVGVAQVLA